MDLISTKGRSLRCALVLFYPENNSEQSGDQLRALDNYYLHMYPSFVYSIICRGEKSVHSIKGRLIVCLLVSFCKLIGDLKFTGIYLSLHLVVRHRSAEIETLCSVAADRSKELKLIKSFNPLSK